MNYHDTRAEYDEIAKWLEENDTEIPWEEIMKSDWWVGPADWVPPPKWSMPKPFPRPITAQTVTKLLLAQENHGLQIPCWPGESVSSVPRVETAGSQQNAPERALGRAPGGEGAEPGPAGAAATGSTPWEKFLQTLENLQLRTVVFRLVTPEERKQLVRMAWIEEELKKREVERNRERVKRQWRGETKKVITRRGVKGLVRGAMMGNREAIRELERRGIVSEEELQRWRGIAERRGERMRKINKERKARSIFWPGDGEMKKTKVEKEEVGEVDSGKRELEVTRVGPNPRILTCRYFLKGVEYSCLVKVKEVKKFRRGMKFEMEEPVDGGVEGPWEYEGKLPRLLGMW